LNLDINNIYFFLFFTKSIEIRTDYEQSFDENDINCIKISDFGFERLDQLTLTLEVDSYTLSCKTLNSLFQKIKSPKCLKLDV
jgi:hypothetical protein